MRIVGMVGAALLVLLTILTGCGEEGVEMILSPPKKPEVVKVGEMKEESVSVSETDTATPSPVEEPPAVEDTTPPVITATLTSSGEQGKAVAGDRIVLTVSADEEIRVEQSRVRWHIGGKQYGDPVVLEQVEATGGTVVYTASLPVTEGMPAGAVHATLTPRDSARNTGEQVLTEGVEIATPYQGTIRLVANERLPESLEVYGNDFLYGTTVGVTLSSQTEGIVQLTIAGVVYAEKRVQGKSVAFKRERRITRAGPVGVQVVSGGVVNEVTLDRTMWAPKVHPSVPAHIPRAFTQGLEIGSSGYWVVGTKWVNPRAISHAIWEIEQIARPEILQDLGRQNAYAVIMEYTQSISDTIELVTGEQTTDIADWIRGLSLGFAVIASEDNILSYEFRRAPGIYSNLDSAVTHEFAHQVHDQHYGAGSAFDQELTRLYSVAKENSRGDNPDWYHGSYELRNTGEFFAVGVGAFFHAAIVDTTSAIYSSPLPPDTQEDLLGLEGNPGELIRQAFRNHEYRWEPVQKLATEGTSLPHLEGWDPVNTPRYDPNLFY